MALLAAPAFVPSVIEMKAVDEPVPPAGRPRERELSKARAVELEIDVERRGRGRDGRNASSGFRKGT